MAAPAAAGAVDKKLNPGAAEFQSSSAKGLRPEAAPFVKGLSAEATPWKPKSGKGNQRGRRGPQNRGGPAQAPGGQVAGAPRPDPQALQWMQQLQMRQLMQAQFQQQVDMGMMLALQSTYAQQRQQQIQQQAAQAMMEAQLAGRGPPETLTLADGTVLSVADPRLKGVRHQDDLEHELHQVPLSPGSQPAGADLLQAAMGLHKKS
eukprot:TRINITY_DN399_c1_g1_i1.p1 TRINITY_DN399_c1_g1~~TRINITY_DN399_c1_g1_i1.p1  ORF type:complete len:205 (+),score=66.85 TRINITY_DN399_c1_g1_i1:105-719(+)